jgi:hypothetical protein
MPLLPSEGEDRGNCGEPDQERKIFFHDSI